MTTGYIFLDTETTGLEYSKDRIIQLSYIIADKEFKIIEGKNFYLNVDTDISKQATEIHKIDNNKLLELSNSKKFEDYAKEILWDFQNSKVICHNTEFDVNFLEEEFRRLGKSVYINKKFCTMSNYTDIVNIGHSYYGQKWPKLEEVVNYLKLDKEELKTAAEEVFGEVGDFHDSRLDVYTTYVIYMKFKSDVIKNYLNKLKTDIDILEQGTLSKITLESMSDNVKALRNIEIAIRGFEGKKNGMDRNTFQDIDDDDIPF